MFKKDPATLDNKSEMEKSSADAADDANSQASPAMSAEDTQAWHDRIVAAAADDTILLELAHQAPAVPLKLAAIEALTQEASFKQAMHDFRDHDKRLYRAAKSLWETASGKRIAAEEVAALIANARNLLEQDTVPVNRVVELDHAWAALNSELLAPTAAAEFADLSEKLGARVRAQGEHAQAIMRWLATADQAMAELNDFLPSIAHGETPPAEAEPLAVALLELVQNVPDSNDVRCAEKISTANRLLALASSAVQRAAFLLTLPAAAFAEDGSSDNEAREKQLIEQWRSFPEISEGGFGEWHTILAARFAEWRNSSTQERQRGAEAHSAQERERRAEQNKKRVSAIQRDIEAAETAHAEGHIGDLSRLLAAIDHALKRGTLNATLTQRIEVLRAEQRRLQEWQSWGGRQGREQLVAEAQVLATQAKEKISIKAHADAIDKLRERWKELDKLGGASNQALWLNFDGALNAAYAPVAAHLEKLKLERNENLTKRELIVEALLQAAAKFFPPSAEGVSANPDWRAVNQALEDAQVAWRKLGPVEHTVPRKMLKGENAITTRYASASQALTAPLRQAHGEARSQRETLISAAKALAESDVTARDVVDKVRKIQTQWQAVAKAMPLPRRDENALWMVFKTATDAIFSGRDAARAAQEAEANAKQQVRVEIIERVAALAQLTAAAEIKRALADAESAWRAAPDSRELPKPHAAKLDSRYRAAREAASKRIAELALRAEQVRYDALIAAMALCAERESTPEPGEAQTAHLQARWDALEDLPAPWKAKLELRFQGKANTTQAKPGKKGGDSLQDTLLNLEVACSLNSPEEFQAARQRLKILALKTAMEGRQASVTTPADIERWMLEAAATATPDDGSRDRLATIIAAVRRRSSR